jgi:Zn finger protein HypA/HybF involved in hydrogenase expression
MSLLKNSTKCKECDDVFIPRHHNAKFCSDNCKSKYQTRRLVNRKDNLGIEIAFDFGKVVK